MLENIKKLVCEANLCLPKRGLVILTEGNVSQISDDRQYIVIKPSGVPYEELTLEKMVVVDLAGKVKEGALRPSTDTPTHIEIYKHFPDIKGIAHTHSTHATIFAQMREPIPCYGTTHADAFHETVPVTRLLSEKEIEEAYEAMTGLVIAELLEERYHPSILVANHGPFTFGKDAHEAVDYAYILEKVATMAILGRYKETIYPALFKKHHDRKHGENRYYGQAREV